MNGRKRFVTGYTVTSEKIRGLLHVADPPSRGWRMNFEQHSLSLDRGRSRFVVRGEAVNAGPPERRIGLA